MLRFARIYLIPGAILQSVMIGGGYGTGREVVEYFSSHGTRGGVFAILTAAVSMAVVFALSLEISRVFKVYDYRNFFKVLLGRFWFLYEILGVMLFMLVIAVIASAAGQILQAELDVPAYMGIVIMLFAVVFLTFYGRNLVVLVLAYWSVFLYAVFFIYIVAVFLQFGDSFVKQPATIKPGWFASGMQYSFYNITAVPMILYAARAITTRRQALLAGISGAAIAIIPAMLLHVSFIMQFPSILVAELPVYDVFLKLDMQWLKFLYLIVLFGTFVETGAGTIQGFVERLDGWWMDRTGEALSREVHALVAGVTVALAGTLAQIGIVALIAQGYGTLAWGFMVVYIIPLLTIGIWRLRTRDQIERPGQAAVRTSS
jgi:uncharacterized membrane protein YkvI